MKEVGERLRTLRESIGLSQMKMADLLGLKQPSINRYEQGTATPTVENLRKYADFFDVSLDYIFARTDNPQGKHYAHQPKILASNRELRWFIEMCFDPTSPYNERLKQTMIQMLEEVQGDFFQYKEEQAVAVKKGVPKKCSNKKKG